MDIFWNNPIKVSLRSNSVFFIYVHDGSFLDNLPNFNLLTNIRTVSFAICVKRITKTWALVLMQFFALVVILIQPVRFF